MNVGDLLIVLLLHVDIRLKVYASTGRLTFH